MTRELHPPPPPGEWRVDGLHFRVDVGRKWPDDRTVFLMPCGHDRMLTFASLGALVGLLTRNEDRGYRHGKGGAFLLEFLAGCYERDLREACVKSELPRPHIVKVDPPALPAQPVSRVSFSALSRARINSVGSRREGGRP